MWCEITRNIQSNKMVSFWGHRVAVLVVVYGEDCSGLNAIWSNCTQLRYATLQGCPPHLNDTSLLMMSQRCRHLVELSVASDQLTVRGLISAMMRASRLQRLCIHGNTRLQVAALKTLILLLIDRLSVKISLSFS